MEWIIRYNLPLLVWMVSVAGFVAGENMYMMPHAGGVMKVIAVVFALVGVAEYRKERKEG